MTAKLYIETAPFARTVTAEEVAKLFCELDNDEQAEFFNAVAEQVDSWDRQFCFQLQAVVDSCKLNAGGISIMRDIGEYGETAIPSPAPKPEELGEENTAHPLHCKCAECENGRGDREYEISRDRKIEREGL